MTPIADQRQRDKALDVDRSVIVQAPAGSGKTTLLVERYLRLLGRADRPEEILAITFTRKAAAEMRARVLEAFRTSAPSAREALQRDREAGWQLTVQPHRLKIQTIDSFASALVHQLPLTADYRPGSRLLENAGDSYAEAVDRLYQRLYREDPLNPELVAVLALFGNDYLATRTQLALMLTRRDQWLDLVRGVVELGRHDTGAVGTLVSAGVGELCTRIAEELTVCLEPAERQELQDVVGAAADNLGIALTDEQDGFRLAGRLLVTGQGTMRRRLTREQGFPAHQRALKAQALELVERLDRRGCAPLLYNLRVLPADSVDDASAEQLTSLCITLLLAVNELDAVLADHNAADFTELVLAATRALSDGDAPTELALALDYRIRHLLIDEFQDTSESQFRLFSLLIAGWSPGDGNSVFAVGDPMQSIYRFRQADVRVFFDAWHHGIAGIPLERVRLTSNFRARPALVDWCNRTFAAVMGPADDPLLGRVAYSAATAAWATADLEPPDSVGARLELLDRGADQARAVVARLEALVAAEPAQSIAVLVRSRSHLTTLLPALRLAGIRWRATDVDPLASRPVVQDLVSLARAMAHPGDRLAWFSVLRAPWVGLDHPDLEVFAATDDFFRALESAELRTRLSDEGAQRVARFVTAWRRGRRLRHEAPPRAALESVWLLAGGVDAYPGNVHLEDAERLLALVDDLGADGNDPDRLQTAAGALFAEDTGTASLEIMTIHKAKGLEFDHVVLPFLERATRPSDQPMLLWRREGKGLLMAGRGTDDLYGWLAREDRARDAHERERLLYVACTRARKGLHLFAEVGERPAAESFLALLWPQLSLTASAHAPATAPRELAAADVTEGYRRLPDASPNARLRLPAGYVWQPRDRELPNGVGIAAAAVSQANLSHLPEVALGTLMHQVLEHLSRTPLPPDPGDYCRTRRHLWEEALEEWGVEGAAHERVVEHLVFQIETVLGDSRARWILEARDRAHAELALTGTGADGALNVFIDRTFVDAGERWIIDYKTGAPAPGVSASGFVAAEVARHTGQLRGYAALARSVFPEPLVLALYFTSLAHLEILPASVGAIS